LQEDKVVGKLRIAVATNGSNGLKDEVSDVFGRAKTFTIVDAENENMLSTKTLENSAANFHHGAGPIAIKMLVDEDVNVVLANDLGFGASELLKQHNIIFIHTKPCTKVEAAINQALQKLK
jgi:predicted Fe-Mo cluster-binding NifX family protein